jgi:hypothetical protein
LADGIEDFHGTWLLNEHGYSPGDRYITEPVSAVPPQWIQFFADGTMSSNITGMTDMKFFELGFDELAQKHFVIVYKTAEDVIVKPQPVHSYAIDFTGGELRLSYRYCIEGCHMKFAKVEQTSTNE